VIDNYKLSFIELRGIEVVRIIGYKICH
jgi:hypothetical protein